MEASPHMDTYGPYGSFIMGNHVVSGYTPDEYLPMVRILKYCFLHKHLNDSPFGIMSTFVERFLLFRQITSLRLGGMLIKYRDRIILIGGFMPAVSFYKVLKTSSGRRALGVLTTAEETLLAMRMA